MTTNEDTGEKTPSRAPTEWRVCWNAGSNITFQGATDWELWTGEGAVEQHLSNNERPGPMNIAPGLEIAIEASGFDWWIETREAQS